MGEYLGPVLEVLFFLQTLFLLSLTLHLLFPINLLQPEFAFFSFCLLSLDFKLFFVFHLLFLFLQILLVSFLLLVSLALELVHELVGFMSFGVTHTIVIGLFHILVVRQFIVGFFYKVLMLQLTPKITDLVLNLPILYLQHPVLVHFLQLPYIIFRFRDLSLIYAYLSEGFHFFSQPACDFIRSSPYYISNALLTQNMYIINKLIITHRILIDVLQGSLLVLASLKIMDFSFQQIHLLFYHLSSYLFYMLLRVRYLSL